MNGVVYVACTNVGRAIIQSHLKNHPNIPILALINLDYDRAIGKANFDPMDDICYENNIRKIRCQSINSDFILCELRSLEPDLIIQSGWSEKFSDELLAIPRYGCIGEHPSPLPIGRGAACVNWAIIEGYKRWGDSFFRMTSVYDVGDVLSINTFEISEFDNCKTVYDKVALSAYSVIKKNLSRWILGNFLPIKLDESTATYYKKRRPEDGIFSFEDTAPSIIQKVRALTRPYPGARFIYQNTEIFTWKASILNSGKSASPPGTSIFLPDSTLSIVCGDGNSIILEEISSRLIPPAPPVIFFEIFFNCSDIKVGKLDFR
jgi:methionyl-tRNA formyltransferase